jgi:tRNA nucleotidyltransferase (CCA-adding enzyme)
VAELLFEFFEFYSEFDFLSKGVCLLTGSAWGKPDASPLYIQNPLERHLNVARNVSKEEVSRFKSKAKEFIFAGKSFGLSSLYLSKAI